MDGAAPDTLDCLVIGAGPGGLVAATYLARFHRRAQVVDAGTSRARWIPESHNCPGFPFGVSGPALLAKLREQAEGYGAQLVPGRVTELVREADRAFTVRADDGRAWRARVVILATGIVDRMPALAGGAATLAPAIEAGVLRLCAVCDGYEASDERIAVYGPADAAISHALFLRTFSRRVDALCATPEPPGAEALREAQAGGVAVRPMPTQLACTPRGCHAAFADGSRAEYDTLYPVLGCDTQSQLALALGAVRDAEGALVVDAHQQTSVEGLYAIGDVVSALNQISVAVGHAAIAATAIHNRLPRNFRELRARQPETAPDLPRPG